MKRESMIAPDDFANMEGKLLLHLTLQSNSKSFISIGMHHSHRVHVWATCFSRLSASEEKEEALLPSISRHRGRRSHSLESTGLWRVVGGKWLSCIVMFCCFHV